MTTVAAKTYTTLCPICHKKWRGPAGTYRCTCGTEYKLYAGQTLGQVGKGLADLGKAIMILTIMLPIAILCVIAIWAMVTS